MVSARGPVRAGALLHGAAGLTGALGLVAGALLLAPPGARGQGEVAPCRVRVELDPPRATVGQQVVYRLRIERRADVTGLRWERNLSFPSFRAEWLPGRFAGATSAERGATRVYEERRALFPVRAGSLAIPPAGLLCRTPQGEVRVEIPGAVLPVARPPEAGRPPDWSGVVGPVEVSVSQVPERVVLGEPLRVAVTVRGPANLWEVAAPFEDLGDRGGLDVFPSPRELARDAGRRLVLRRYFTYDLVPRRTGAFALPPVSIPWLDPATGLYRRTTVAIPRFRVEEGGPGPGREEGPPPTSARASAPVGDDPTPPFGAIAAAALALALGAAALAWVRRARPGLPVAEEDRERAAAEAALRAGEHGAAAAAAARAIRSELSARVPDARALSTEELFERVGEPDRALVLLLQRLDRARFARGQGPDEVRAVCAALRERGGTPPPE